MRHHQQGRSVRAVRPARPPPRSASPPRRSAPAASPGRRSARERSRYGTSSQRARRRRAAPARDRARPAPTRFMGARNTPLPTANRATLAAESAPAMIAIRTVGVRPGGRQPPAAAPRPAPASAREDARAPADDHPEPTVAPCSGRRQSPERARSAPRQDARAAGAVQPLVGAEQVAGIVVGQLLAGTPRSRIARNRAPALGQAPAAGRLAGVVEQVVEAAARRQEQIVVELEQVARAVPALRPAPRPAAWRGWRSVPSSSATSTAPARPAGR